MRSHSLPGLVFIIMIVLNGAVVAEVASFARQAEDSSVFTTDTTLLTKSDSLFNNLHLGKLGLGRVAYDYAMLGYYVLRKKGKLKNENVLTIADMSTPSRNKRLFVIDMKNEKLLFVTYVAHGKNSGLDKTLFFSNKPESNMSSVGFYITLGTYNRLHGYSLRLDGQEIGFNNKALEREIVMQSSDLGNFNSSISFG